MTHLMNTVKFRALGITSGRGAMLVNDKTDKAYIDFFCDVGTASLGYGSEQMRSALREVMSEGIVHSPILFQHDNREDAARILCQFTAMDKVFFCNSGAEAVEAAIKMARKHWWETRSKTSDDLPIIWCQEGSFHGRTIAGIAAGDGPKYHRSGFAPLPPGFIHFKHWKEIPSDAAAVLISPVFGNNDVRPWHGESWRDGIAELAQLRKFCTDNNITLIFDEVQSGAGRCGEITYAIKAGVLPDIMTMGKGIAMGAPVGAMLARGNIADTFTPGTHFSTFGGNPLCCSFLMRMLEWLGEADHLEGVERIGATIQTVLGEAGVGAIRRTGALVAVDVKCNPLELAGRCEDAGLLLGAFRHGPGPLKITPPLNISQSELRCGLDILVSQLKALS